MTKKTKYRSLASGITLTKALLAILAAAWVCAAQQNPPLLQITSPVSGSIVNPGQTISVTVTSPANAAFAQVAVVGEDPIEFSSTATSVPAQFPMVIPASIAACRKYMLTAVGTTTSGQKTESETILIDVERPDFPVSLSSNLQGLTFQAPGDKTPFVILATFSDGSVLDVSESSYVTYASANTSVVSVDANAMVTAVAAGSGSVTATYTRGPISLQISVPVKVPPPLTISPLAVNFGAQLVGTSSAPRTVTLTNASDISIHIQVVSTSGDFSQTNTCVSTSPLAPGATCGIDVTFVPSIAGTRTGSVSILNDSSQTTFVVTLTGTGTSDFSISATPTTQTVTAGNSTSYTISVSPRGGFTGAVALSVTGLPTKATANFSPASISAGSGSSTLTVTTSTQTPVGGFTLTITGRSGSLAHTASVTLTVNPRR